VFVFFPTGGNHLGLSSRGEKKKKEEKKKRRIPSSFSPRGGELTIGRENASSNTVKGGGKGEAPDGLAAKGLEG